MILLNHTVYKIRREGMPINESGYRGDLYIEFDVVFPDYISDERKNYLRRLLTKKNPGEEMDGEENGSKGRGMDNTIKMMEKMNSDFSNDLSSKINNINNNSRNNISREYEDIQGEYNPEMETDGDGEIPCHPQ